MELLVLGTLVPFLLIATWHDFKRYRIPNVLMLAGALAGLLVCVVVGNGVLFSFLGGLTGFALFVVPYALGKMGAGDVKMLAMSGTFLGWKAVIWAALWSVMAGGFVALFWLYYLKIRPDRAYGSTDAKSSNEQNIETSGKSTKVPYALAIAIGTLMALYQVMDYEFALWA